MRPAIVALIASLCGPAAAQDAVGTRIAQSAEAAERLQGPLDGTWTLRDPRGRALFVFQIGDPPSGGELSCAWRASDGAPRTALCRRTGGHLTIAFESAGRQHVALRTDRAGVWRGELFVGNARHAVSLRRD